MHVVRHDDDAVVAPRRTRSNDLQRVRTLLQEPTQEPSRRRCCCFCRCHGLVRRFSNVGVPSAARGSVDVLGTALTAPLLASVRCSAHLVHFDEPPSSPRPSLFFFVLFPRATRIHSRGRSCYSFASCWTGDTGDDRRRRRRRNEKTSRRASSSGRPAGGIVPRRRRLQRFWRQGLLPRVPRVQQPYHVRPRRCKGGQETQPEHWSVGRESSRRRRRRRRRRAFDEHESDKPRTRTARRCGIVGRTERSGRGSGQRERSRDHGVSQLRHS